MTRAAGTMLASLLLLGPVASADIDAGKYRELPGNEHRMVSSMTVRADDAAIDAAVRRRYAGQHPSGDYDLYFGSEGTVDGVHVIRSLEGCDELIASHLVTARVTPKPPAPFVRHVTVELRFENGAAPAAPAALRAKNVPPQAFDAQLVSRDRPHLPDAVKAKATGSELVWMAKICATVDGHISEIAVAQGIPGADDAIVATLRGWRLRPQPIPICTMLRFEFEVDKPPKQRK